MCKRSGGGATAESAAGAIHDNRMFTERAFYCIANGAGNVREKVTVKLIINISTNYVGVDKWEASN